MWDLQTPETNRPWPSCRHAGSMSTHTVRTGWAQLLGLNARLHTSFQFRTSWGKCLTMTGRTNIKKDALLVGRQEMMLSASAQCGCCCSSCFYFNKPMGGGWERKQCIKVSKRVQSRQFLKSPVFQTRALAHLGPHSHEHLLFFSEQSALPRNDRTFQGTKRADQVLFDMALTEGQNT